LYRGGRAILEPLGVEHGAHRGTFVGSQRPGGWRAKDYRSKRHRTEHRLAIERCTRHAESIASGFDADGGRELVNGGH